MKYGFGELDVFIGDAWELANQAIVCPVHDDLRPMAGAGAGLLRRAGPDISAELNKRESLALGHALLTDSGSLRSKWLIHIAIGTSASSPTVYDLEDAINEALLICQRRKISSVAIPAVAIEPGELPATAVVNIMVRAAFKSLKISSCPQRIVCVVPSTYVDQLFQKVIEHTLDQESGLA
jgi:O-acetyl-ADP-ribose deacetylase (regulator of RNase III)